MLRVTRIQTGSKFADKLEKSQTTKRLLENVFSVGFSFSYFWIYEKNIRVQKNWRCNLCFSLRFINAAKVDVDASSGFISAGLTSLWKSLVLHDKADQLQPNILYEL